MAQWAKIVTLTVVAALALFAVIEPRLASDPEPERNAALPAVDPAAGPAHGSGEAAANEATDTNAETTDVADDAADSELAALQELQERIEADPTDAEAWRILGGYFLTARDYPRAAEAFAAVLEFHEDDAETRANLGMALLYQGLVRVARAQLIEALVLDDSLAEAHLNLGITYSHASPASLDVARDEWERTIELAPDSDLANQAQDYLDAYTAASTDAPADAVSAE